MSKKGFDTEVSPRHASPILPDGRLLPLPIPEPKQSPDDVGVPFRDLHAFDSMSMDDVLDQLNFSGPGRLRRAHLDPDRRPGARPRADGWRPLFGTDNTSGSASHLRNEQISTGDVFLFHGRFRQTRWVRGRLSYVNAFLPLQIMFGYLEDSRPAMDSDQRKRRTAAARLGTFASARRKPQAAG